MDFKRLHYGFTTLHYGFTILVGRAENAGNLPGFDPKPNKLPRRIVLAIAEGRPRAKGWQDSDSWKYDWAYGITKAAHAVFALQH